MMLKLFVRLSLVDCVDNRDQLDASGRVPGLHGLVTGGSGFRRLFRRISARHSQRNDLGTRRLRLPVIYVACEL
jgi:hypothetical protein